MAFAIMPCPYCGGTTTPCEDRYDICQNCGKSLFKSRSDLMTFVSAVDRDEDFGPIIDMVRNDNLPKALSSIDAIIETDDTDKDAYFIRGLVYCEMGEDGKALIDWKKGLDLLDTFCNIDAYVCLMGVSISDLIFYKESEFISFDQLRFIDRVGEMPYECTGDSCKMNVYYTICKIYMQMMDEKGIGFDDSLFLDIVPGIFRRIIEYNRNYPSLLNMIDIFLGRMEYNEETYEEDDNYECHLYYMVKIYLEAYTKDFTDEDVNRIMAYWNDENMKELEDQFEIIASCVVDSSLISKLRLLRNGDENCDVISNSVNDYVKKYLLLTGDPSIVVKILQ